MGLSRNVDGKVVIHWTMEDAARAEQLKRERREAQIRAAAAPKNIRFRAAGLLVVIAAIGAAAAAAAREFYRAWIVRPCQRRFRRPTAERL